MRRNLRVCLVFTTRFHVHCLPLLLLLYNTKVNTPQLCTSPRHIPSRYIRGRQGNTLALNDVPACIIVVAAAPRQAESTKKAPRVQLKINNSNTPKQISNTHAGQLEICDNFQDGKISKHYAGELEIYCFQDDFIPLQNWHASEGHPKRKPRTADTSAEMDNLVSSPPPSLSRPPPPSPSLSGCLRSSAQWGRVNAPLP